MNYYRRYIGDFQRDTGHLSLVEVGAYDRLLDHYYSTGKPLPDDFALLFRICRAMRPAERVAVRKIAAAFFPLEAGLRRNSRADFELERFLTTRKKQKESMQAWWLDRRLQGYIPTTNHQPSTRTRSKPIALREARAAVAPVNGEAVAHIPIADGSEWGVPKPFLEELERAYPAVDGPATLREIRAWCVANPERRKTPRGVMRFINRWFEKVQNHG